MLLFQTNNMKATCFSLKCDIFAATVQIWSKDGFVHVLLLQENHLGTLKYEVDE